MGQAYPLNPGGWVVIDGETYTFRPPRSYDGGTWHLYAYNTGSNSHAIYVEIETVSLATLAALDAWDQPVYISQTPPDAGADLQGRAASLGLVTPPVGPATPQTTPGSAPAAPSPPAAPPAPQPGAAIATHHNPHHERKEK
jgi:hypothetical protein